MFKIPGHKQISGTVRHTLVNGVHNVRTQMAVSIQIDVSSTSYYQSKEIKHAESLIFFKAFTLYITEGVTNMLFLNYSICLMR